MSPELFDKFLPFLCSTLRLKQLKVMLLPKEGSFTMTCKDIEQKNPFLVRNGYRLISYEEGVTENPIQFHSREIWHRYIDGELFQLERWLLDGVEKNSREYRADTPTARIRRSNVLPSQSRLSA